MGLIKKIDYEKALTNEETQSKLDMRIEWRRRQKRDGVMIRSITCLLAALLFLFVVACGGEAEVNGPGGFGGTVNTGGTGGFGGTVDTGGTGGVGGTVDTGGFGGTGGAGGTMPQGPAPVDLGAAGDFAILAKAGVTNVSPSVIVGHIGVSPIAAASVTGFSLIMDASNEFSTSTQIFGRVYAADYAPPTPAYLTMAVSDMEAAYTDAAGRSSPDVTELGAGDVSGLTIVPGLYKWGTGVLISTDVTLDGGPQDVWIFQISGAITVAPAASVVLSGGALPKNIFWQSAGAIVLDTTSHFEGVILSMTEITLATGATIDGRLLSQTAVTLDAVAVTQPAL